MKTFKKQEQDNEFIGLIDDIVLIFQNFDRYQNENYRNTKLIYVFQYG